MPSFGGPLGSQLPFFCGRACGPILWLSYLTVLMGLIVRGTGSSSCVTKQIMSHPGSLICAVN